MNITSNVNFRMITPAERAMFAAGDVVIPDHFEETIASRLTVSLRDEAIWQYHAGRHRGVVLWCADQTFRYVPEAQWKKLIPTMGNGLNSLPPVLTDYDPVSEALVMSKTGDSLEVYRIGDDGGWTLVWHMCSLKPAPGSHSESGLSPETRSE